MFLSMDIARKLARLPSGVQRPLCYRCSMLRFFAAFTFFFVVVQTPTALGNGRFPSSNQIAFHPSDSQIIVARTTFGLLISRDGGTSFHWVCEQLLQTRMLEDPAIAVMNDGSTLVSLFIGQRRGTPDDCSWDFVTPELQNRLIIDNVRDPSNPAAAWVLTSDGSRPNSLWHTSDNGVGWAQVGDTFDGVLFETVEVAPSNSQRLYLTGAIPPTSSMPRRTYVYRSDDGGLHWESFEFHLETGAQTDLNIYLAAVDPANEDRVFMRVRGAPDDKLMLSVDGGETFDKVISFAGMAGFARSDDGQHVWVGADNGDASTGLFHSEDRGENFDPVMGRVELGDGTTTEIPLRISCLAARGDQLWACGNNYADRFTLGYSSDYGATFTPALRFADIQGPPSTCGAETDVQTGCSSEYPGLMTLLGIDGGVSEEDAGGVEDGGVADMGMDAGPPPAEPTPGCACEAGGAQRTSPFSSVLVLASLAALVLSIRRKRTR